MLAVQCSPDCVTERTVGRLSPFQNSRINALRTCRPATARDASGLGGGVQPRPRENAWTRTHAISVSLLQRLADAPARSPSPPERVPSELTFIPLICCAASEFSDFISLHTCSSFSVRRWMPFSLASNQSPSGLNRPALSPAQVGDGAQSGRAPERRDLRADLSAGGSASAHGSVAAGENACMGRRCSECGYRR